jgi:hypothetical protein
MVTRSGSRLEYPEHREADEASTRVDRREETAVVAHGGVRLVVERVAAIDGQPVGCCLNKDAAVRSRVRQKSGAEAFTHQELVCLRDGDLVSIRADPVAAAAAHE